MVSRGYGGRAAREKRNPFRFAREGLASMEAVRKPLLPLDVRSRCGDDASSSRAVVTEEFQRKERRDFAEVAKAFRYLDFLEVTL